MGVVYKAHDTSLDRVVALKFLTASLADHEDARKRFINEAKAASSLEHPNICVVHEIGQTDDGHTYIVMPFYDGESLSACAERGVSVEEAIDLIMQAATGLAKAHEKGITHRDIKSQNLLVTSDGHVKVVDFGLAKLAGQTRVTRTGTTVGTLMYMSPEQARGEEVDSRTDIYSLGVVLYELLTGTLPFHGAHDAAVLYSVLNTDPAPPSATVERVPAALDSVVMRALSKDRDERYDNIEEMIADLKRVSAGESVAMTAPVLRGNRKSRVRAGVVTVVSAAAIALVVWYVGARRTNEPQPGVARGQKSIGVMYFQNLSADPELDWMQNGIVELLNTALSRSAELTILDSQHMARIVSELGGDPDRGVSQAMATDVAQRAGVGTMLVGNIIKSGKIIRLQVKIIDVESGEIRNAEFVDGRIDDDIFKMVAVLTEKIQTHLQISSIAETVDEEWIRGISTASVDAYRHYVQGRQHFVRNEHEQAREYFERAIETDSNFVMAYVDLVGSCFNLDDFACVGAAFEEAMRLRPNASHKEKIYIDIIGAIIDDEHELQISLSREILAIDPGAQFWRYTLGRGYYMSKRYEEALVEWAPLINAGYDWVWTYVYAGSACRRLKRYDEGLRILQKGFDVTRATRSFARSRLHRIRGQVHRDMGNIEFALEDFRACVELDSEYEAVIKYDLGILYEQEGETARAIRYYEEYLAAAADDSFAHDARARIERLR